MNMSFRILLLVAVVCSCSASLSPAYDAERPNSGNAPFFELPCMAVGGICARSVACPKGTEVGLKGLCPVQQDLGMECCRSPKEERCKAQGGECLSPTDFKCPRQLHVGVDTDCTVGQICCVYV